jgi:O-antigen ligase
MEIDTTKRNYSLPIVLLMIYILFEYGKPEFLRPLHAGLLLQVFFAILLLFNLNRIKCVLNDTFFRLYVVMVFEMMILVFISLNNYWAYEYFKGFIETFIFALSICVFIDDIQKLKILLTSYVVVLTLISLGKAFGGAWISLETVGFLGDTNDLAMGMNAVIPVSFYLGLESRGMKRALYWIAGLIQVFTVGLAASRGGFVGLVFVITLCWWKSKNKLQFLVLFIVATVIFLSVISSGYRNELLNIFQSAEGGTGKGRLELWKVGWRAFVENPVFGVGQGNLPKQLGDYAVYGPDSYWQRNISGTAVHSVYITCIAELGLVGTITWILMNFNNIKKYRYIIAWCKHNDGILDRHGSRTAIPNITTGLAIAMIGYLVSGIFLSAFYYPHFWFLSAMITSIYLIANNTTQKVE